MPTREDNSSTTGAPTFNQRLGQLAVDNVKRNLGADCDEPTSDDEELETACDVSSTPKGEWLLNTKERA